jgi:hypothetical protein
MVAQTLRLKFHFICSDTAKFCLWGARMYVTGVCKFPVKILAFRLATPIASMEYNYQRFMPITNHRLVKSLIFS